MSISVMVLVSRWIMAGIFIYAGSDKCLHPTAFALDVYNYRILPDAWVNWTALVLPWLELVLGLCLLVGIWLPGAVLAANGLLVVFLTALLLNLARGLDVHCGCFGSGVQVPPMSTGGYLLRDLGFLAVGSILLYDMFWRQRHAGAQKAPGQVPACERIGRAKKPLATGTSGRRHRVIADKTIHGRATRQVAAMVMLSALAAVTANSLRTESLPLALDGSAAPRAAPDGREHREISLSEAQQLFADDAAVFFDARSFQEYARGRIRGARSLPWGEIDGRFIGATEGLDLQTPIVTYCDGEMCELSHHLARFLVDAGFANTRVLVNGWALWRQAGLPLDADRPP